MSDSPMVVVSSTEADVYRIEIAKEDFKDFMGSILGKRRSLERRIEGKFVIDMNFLTNMHERIMQRVERQQNMIVATFLCVVDFNDGFQRTFSSADTFIHHEETKIEEVSRLQIQYSFLIQFPDKRVPEKQEVVVDFDTFGNKPLAIEPFPPGTVFEYDRQNLSKVTIKVDYSEITWGDDIERMLTEYVKAKTVN